MERARPVLETQPPLPRTILVYYAMARYCSPCMELVSIQSYALEPFFELYEPHTRHVDAYRYCQDESSSMMLIGSMMKHLQRAQQPYPPRKPTQTIPNLKCYRCAKDYLVKDCLEPSIVPPIK